MSVDPVPWKSWDRCRKLLCVYITKMRIELQIDESVVLSKLKRIENPWLVHATLMKSRHLKFSKEASIIELAKETTWSFFPFLMFLEKSIQITYCISWSAFVIHTWKVKNRQLGTIQNKLRPKYFVPNLSMLDERSNTWGQYMCFKVHTTKLQQLKKKFNTYRDNNSESTHYLTEINRILWMCTHVDK